MKKTYPLSKVYALLEPGPVVLVTTAQKGRANVMTLSWLTPMEFTPPRVGIVMGEGSYSFAALKATKECVINIPTAELARKVVAVGNSSGRRLDKFKTFGLSPRPAKRVAAPLIEECYASLECRVTDAHLARKYNFFVLEVLQAWVDPARKRPRLLHHLGRGRFAVDGEIITLPSRMK